MVAMKGSAKLSDGVGWEFDWARAIQDLRRRAPLANEAVDVKVENKIGDALVQRIIRAHKDRKPWKCCVMLPLLPGFTFPVDHNDASAVRVHEDSALGRASHMDLPLDSNYSRVPKQDHSKRARFHIFAAQTGEHRCE